MYANFKLVVSGRSAELYCFERPVELGNSTRVPKNKRVLTDNYMKKSADFGVHRSQRALRRLIECNAFAWDCMPIFVTLTFSKNVSDLKVANYQFTKFIQRLNYQYFKSKSLGLQYVAVPEFQKDVDFRGNVKKERGSVHFHVIFFNLPFIDRIYDNFRQIWRVCGFAGSVRVVAIRDVRGVGVYIAKYFSKSFSDKRFFNQKRYFSSKSLRRSVVLYDEVSIAKVLEFGRLKFMRWLGNFDFTGWVQYYKFDLSPIVDKMCVDNTFQKIKMKVHVGQIGDNASGSQKPLFR